MRFLVAEKLGPHKFKTPEGYLICTDAILSRTGKQEYKRCEIFGDACDEPDEIVSVDRVDTEVFSDKAMASFENKPICIEHPDQDVNIENHNELAVGFVRDIHKGEDNGHPVMMGTLVITDKDAIEAVESEEYKELSCGYDCDIDDDDNPQQRNIRGNHVALCKQGRAGIARIVDSVKDVNDLTKFKMALRNISKMYSSDPGIEYVTSTLKNLGYEVVIDSIDGWKENKNVPGEHIKQYRMNVMLEGREHHFLVQLYADMGEWKVKEINAYMLDSDNTKQGDSIKDEDFSKKTKQGYQVLEMYRDGGRLHIIFKRANDFGIGLGYDTTDGQWVQGRYDFSTLEKARKVLVEEKPYARRIQDSVNDDNWSSVEEENYEKANKAVIDEEYVQLPRGRFKVVEKTKEELEREGYGYHHSANGYSVYVKNNKAVAIKDSKEQLFTIKYKQGDTMNIHKMKTSTMQDSIVKVNDNGCKKQLFTVEYKQGNTTYIRKVKASTIQDAIEQVKRKLTDGFNENTIKSKPFNVAIDLLKRNGFEIKYTGISHDPAGSYTNRTIRSAFVEATNSKTFERVLASAPISGRVSNVNNVTSEVKEVDVYKYKDEEQLRRYTLHK